ncbi:MAG: ferritin-like domain-containing protein [Chloroflexi bacterium]|nr:ferritin-like domain-containing protein [Chloroflexota bacterium]
MLDSEPAQADPQSEARELLERALDLEYRFIFHYPRLSRLMPSPALAQRVQVLGQDSVRHAEVVTRLVAALGGRAIVPTVDPLPAPLDLKDLFCRQLEREKLGLYFHSTAANLASGELASHLRQIADQEQWHIRMTEEILAALDKPGSPHPE